MSGKTQGSHIIHPNDTKSTRTGRERVREGEQHTGPLPPDGVVKGQNNNITRGWACRQGWFEGWEGRGMDREQGQG
ncbi:hypothetical protein E2C01_077743 [Portunus trituberculatus]|uniref:Uncharacterized protein n=1 Tax=Portunus trituberculatus TaxID=210409 RepID=A0A5B7IL00_PORTR|nr:hypothetical protein [Portunus trituberculatus]